MSDLNDQPEVCFDHPRPSFLVALLNAGGKLDLLLRAQQRCLHDLSEVTLNSRFRIVSHAPTSPQIVLEATAGFDRSSMSLTTLGGARFLFHLLPACSGIVTRLIHQDEIEKVRFQTVEPTVLCSRF